MARLQLLALVAAALLARADAVKLHLTPYQVDCVTEIAKTGDTVSGSFVGYVQDHRGQGNAGYPTMRTYFDLEVKGEDGYMVYRVPHRQDSKFEFQAPKTGRYFVCIRNYGRYSAEVLYHSHVGHMEDHGKLNAEHLEPARATLRNLKTLLQDILEEQLYQERRDYVHFGVNQNIDTRSKRSAVVESLVIVAFSIGQVVVIRKLIGKRTVGGLLPRFGV